MQPSQPERLDGQPLGFSALSVWGVSARVRPANRDDSAVRREFWHPTGLWAGPSAAVRAPRRETTSRTMRPRREGRPRLSRPARWKLTTASPRADAVEPRSASHPVRSRSAPPRLRGLPADPRAVAAAALPSLSMPATDAEEDARARPTARCSGATSSDCLAACARRQPRVESRRSAATNPQLRDVGATGRPPAGGRARTGFPYPTRRTRARHRGSQRCASSSSPRPPLPVPWYFFSLALHAPSVLGKALAGAALAITSMAVLDDRFVAGRRHARGDPADDRGSVRRCSSVAGIQPALGHVFSRSRTSPCADGARYARRDAGRPACRGFERVKSLAWERCELFDAAGPVLGPRGDAAARVAVAVAPESSVRPARRLAPSQAFWRRRQLERAMPTAEEV